MSHNSGETDLAAVRRLIQRGQSKEAYDRCLLLAQEGSPKAQLLVGWMYLAGRGVQQNVEAAEAWIRKAVKADFPQAEFYLGAIFRFRGDYRTALEWFTRSACNGYIPAIYHLGRIYRFGEGVPEDRSKAFEYIEEAAAKGHLFARRDVAGEMMSGRRGILKIPLGILEFARALWTSIKVGWKEPESPLTLRL